MSRSPLARAGRWLTSAHSVAIYAAILVGVPVSFAFHVAVETGTGLEAGSFLLLLTLSVGVPRTVEGHVSAAAGLRTRVTWVVLACVVVTVQFALLYVAGVDLLGLDPTAAGVLTFSVTSLVDPVVLRRVRGGD